MGIENVHKSPLSKRGMRRPKAVMRRSQVMEPGFEEGFKRPAGQPAPVDALSAADRAELEELRAARTRGVATSIQSPAPAPTPEPKATTYPAVPEVELELEDDLGEYDEPFSVGELTETIRDCIAELKESHGLTFELVMK